MIMYPVTWISTKGQVEYNCMMSFSAWLFYDVKWGGDVLNRTLCDKVCQWLVTGRWVFPSTPVSSTNKTDRHDITAILLKVALNSIILNQKNTAVELRYNIMG
jgi:hypothetical protein